MEVSPSDAGYEAYAAWKGWDASGFGHFSRSDARYYDWHLTRCWGAGWRGRARELRVLELGFGNGGFLGWALAQGLSAEGIETQPELVQRAQAAGWTVWPGLEAAPGAARFDAVVAFDVLEHIAPPQWPAAWGGIAARLAPGGALLLRVPNGDSPFGRLSQHGDITHEATFGLDKLRQLAARHGLAVVAWDEAPWHRRQGMSRTATNLLRAGARGLLEAWIRYAYAWSGVPLSPNLVAVLKRAADASA